MDGVIKDSITRSKNIFKDSTKLVDESFDLF